MRISLGKSWTMWVAICLFALMMVTEKHEQLKNEDVTAVAVFKQVSDGREIHAPFDGVISDAYQGKVRVCMPLDQKKCIVYLGLDMILVRSGQQLQTGELIGVYQR